ncbi:MAG TPA: DUF5686 and carboxypeptidase regulatory-like domain-containing protein [Sediminibacterium sp.]|nr:DUF5686 and carboxypeptidase regulatory-like domain-containing protein [Sediminibacterium sp.]
MKQLLLVSILFCTACAGWAGTISGIVRTSDKAILPFASVLVKGTPQGTAANNRGEYSLNLAPGNYTLVCQCIGYASQEKTIRVTAKDQSLDFELTPQQYQLQEVVVNNKGEDPAYAIIRKAIATREAHRKEIKQFQCQVYIKGQIQLRHYPRTFMGRKMDFQDGDTSMHKMIFLSETLAKYSVEQPGTEKVEVLSTRVSGRSSGFGLSNPQIISFYDNNIAIGENLNPRGFISPIANGALNYYRYRFAGSYFENGKEISRIEVIPKRKYEPLFSGYIQIIENEWRIQSVDLLLLKENQLQFLDTLRVQQLYVPSGNYEVIKSQVIYPSGKFLGFDFFGSFVQVYDRFDMHPHFARKFFDNTIIRFTDSSNKKTKAYWDSIRPVPLLTEEVRDYKKKDSLEQVRKSPHYLDSLDAKNNRLHPGALLMTGQTFLNRKAKTSFSFPSILSNWNVNTVEGVVWQFTPGFRKRWEGRKFLSISPDIRYGFGNGHLNTSVAAVLGLGKHFGQSFRMSGGTGVFQFNPDNPITPRINTISTLFYEANHLKLYEAAFWQAGYRSGLGKGLTLNAGFQYQDRKPLENLADPLSWRDIPGRDFTPNFPKEVGNANIPRHQASILSLHLFWQPGAKYIELPDRSFSIGSGYPGFSAGITWGIPGLLSSDVDYLHWHFAVHDDVNMNLFGKLEYQLQLSGFLRNKMSYLPDYQHYLGNQTILANQHLEAFQLLPYYAYSNTASFNSSAHLEYHLNGFISNKIPGFKQLNWFFVTGIHYLHVPGKPDYGEFSAGLENIFKLMRVDFVQGIAGSYRPNGLRLTIPFF